MRTVLLKGKSPTVNISQISMIMYPIKKICISLQIEVSAYSETLLDLTDLRPTAACFRSDRHRRKAETAIAIPQRRITPVQSQPSL